MSAPTSRSTTADPGAVHQRRYWLDGAFVAALPPLVPGCYTTGRYSAGVLRHAELLAERLCEDARRLGLGTLEPTTCLKAMREVGEVHLGRHGGVVRLDAARERDGGLRLLARSRDLGPEQATWRVVLHPELHPGAREPLGVKRAGDVPFERAAERAQQFGADESLLVGADDCVVEGARSNLFALLADGRLVTPPLESGAVDGISRRLLLARLSDVVEQPIPRRSLLGAREVILTNAVRGAIAVTRIDGTPVGTGAVPVDGAARRMAALLDSLS